MKYNCSAYATIQKNVQHDRTLWYTTVVSDPKGSLDYSYHR